MSCDWPCRVVRLEACDLCPGFVRSRVPGGAVNHVDEFFLESIRRRGTWAASICGLQVSSEVYVRVAMLRFEVFGLFLGRRIAYGFLICCFACVLVPAPNTGHYVGQAVLCTLHSFQMKGGQFNFFSIERKLGPGPQLHSPGACERLHASWCPHFVCVEARSFRGELGDVCRNGVLQLQVAICLAERLLWSRVCQ